MEFMVSQGRQTVKKRTFKVMVSIVKKVAHCHAMLSKWGCGIAIIG